MVPAQPRVDRPVTEPDLDPAQRPTARDQGGCRESKCERACPGRIGWIGDDVAEVFVQKQCCPTRIPAFHSLPAMVDGACP